MSAGLGTGIVHDFSNHSVGANVEKLPGIVAAKVGTIFALVDHSGGAPYTALRDVIVTHPTTREGLI